MSRHVGTGSQGLSTSATTVVSGGVDSDAQSFVIATSDVPAGVDPSKILGSVTQDGDDITVTLDALTMSNTPTWAVYWETDLVNIFGEMTEFDLADIFRAVIRIGALVPATDLWVGIALKSADDRGVAWRLAAVRGDWEVQHATQPTGGGDWSSWTSSTAHANTQGLQGGAILGNGTTQGRINASALDAVGNVIGGAATTTPSQINIGNNFTKVRLCVGWIAGGIGTNPTVITFKAGWIHSKLLDFPRMGSFFSVSPAEEKRSSQPTTFVIAGQSNAEGVTDDLDWSGHLLQSGVHVVDRGVDLTTYPILHATPKNGPLPHLIKRALAAGATTVNVVRRSMNGQNITACINTDLPLIVTDLQAKGWTPDYWLLWQGEAETLNPAQSPAGEYEVNLTKYCKLIFSHFPNCRVALMTLLMRTSDYGGKGASKDYDLIVAAQIAVAAAFPDRVILVDTQVPSILSMADTVHASAGDGGGYDTGMSRFRDTWLTLDAELVQPAVTPTPDIVSLRSDTEWTGRLHVHSGTSTRCWHSQMI